MYLLNETANTGPSREKLEAAARAAEMAANAETPQEEYRAVMAVLAHKEAIEIGMMTATMNRCSQAPRLEERLPLRESGDDIGRVEARIPKRLFFHLMKQKNFGWEGLTSNEGMRDLLKAYPICKVKTISGKTTVPVGANFGRGRKSSAVFGRGTLVLAN